MFYNRVICPFCLTEIRYKQDVYECPNCKDGLPPEYVLKSGQNPPCFAQIIGWSSHGKSVYLQTLTGMMMNFSNFWGVSYNHAAQTDPTLNYEREVRKYIQTGEMPPATQLNLQDAYIMQLVRMDRWGNRTFIARDVAGEFFKKLQIPIQFTPYLLHVPTVIMLCSLHDLKASNYSIDELLNSYVQTLLSHKNEYQPKKRNVIFALSKADLIMDELPSAIRDYLLSDPFSNILTPNKMEESPQYVDLELYVQKMRNISEEIKSWIMSHTSGKNLISRAIDNNFNLIFSILSSTGSPVSGDNKMQIGIRPLRVQDPFFWTLELESRP